ncbi:MAG: hypothetical protein DBX44_01185 [Oscillospiraceae bacterium]|nr:MAG: hypothetical protein DBX44_01185 [Oscillospiraceae bacterium]
MRRMLPVWVLLFLFLFSWSIFADGTVYLDQNEAFIETNGDRPRRVLLDEGRLRTVQEPGTIFCFPIVGAQRAEDLSGLRVTVNWNKGEELAARPRIEYRQTYSEEGEPLGYRYLAVLSPIDMGATGTMQGEIRITRRASEETVSVPFTISLQSREQEGRDNLYRCNSEDLWVNFSDSEDWATLLFYDSVEFVVPTEGQSPLNIGCSIRPLTDYLERYPGIEMRFFCWEKRPVFDYPGTLLFPAQEGEFLYRIVPGGFTDCSASYLAEKRGFVLETRNLGEFVITSEPLDPSAPPGALPNPPVGACP